MVKVTLNKNLVPYAGPMPAERPNRAIPWDLTHNYILACKLIRVASVLFELGRDTAIFSGYIYDKTDSSFKIRIYHKGSLIKELALHELGYGGLLHVELITQNAQTAVRFDLLGCLKEPGYGVKPIALSAE